MNKNNILVTGGSGLVGTYLKEIMPNAKYISSKDYDLRDNQQVKNLFRFNSFDTVIHLGAKIGGLIENLQKPAEIYDDNILINTNIIKNSYLYGIKNFIGMLSTCIYPDKVKKYPLKLEKDLHAGIPPLSNIGYAYSKRAMAIQIDSYNKQYGTKYNYLIPCNLYGIHDNFENENKMHFVSALIKKIYNAKENNEKYITLYGTGKPLRQFLCCSDLVQVIKYCIDNNIKENFNVVTNENYSIKQIAEIALKACDAENLEIQFDSTKPDGQYRKDASDEKLKKLIPEFKATSLYEGIKITYNTLKNKWNLNK